MVSSLSPFEHHAISDIIEDCRIGYLPYKCRSHFTLCSAAQNMKEICALPQSFSLFASACVIIFVLLDGEGLNEPV